MSWEVLPECHSERSASEVSNLRVSSGDGPVCKEL